MLPPKDFPDAAFHEEVGRLCGAWAFLEAMLQHTIWDLLKIDQSMGRYVTYRLDAKLRWQMVLELALEKDAAFHATLKANNSTMERLAAARNLIVHGVIAWNPAQQTVCWIIFKGAKAGVPQPATTEFVIQTREAIQELARIVRPTAKNVYPD